jgi:putative ABC transport system permease protein
VINKLVLENLKQRPIRTSLSILLIGVPVTLILTLVGLSQGTLEDSARRQRGVGADIVIRPRGSSLLALSTAPIPEGLLGMLSGEPHITAVTGTVIQPLSGLNSITGVDLPSFTRISGGFRYLDGGPFRGPDDIIVDQFYAGQNNLRAGSTLSGILNREWRVAGIVEGGKLARVMLPIRVLQDLTGNTGKLSQIYVKVDTPDNVETVVASLRQKLEGYPIYSMDELLSLVSVNNVPMLRGFIDVVVGIGIIIGFAVVFLSMYTSVLQRTREIGILKSLGASRWYVLNIVLREATLLAVGGTVLGILLSFATKWVIAEMVPASLTQKIVLEWWPIAGLIALVGSLIGGLYPGYQAARQDPIEALAYE